MKLLISVLGREKDEHHLVIFEILGLRRLFQVWLTVYAIMTHVSRLLR